MAQSVSLYAQLPHEAEVVEANINQSNDDIAAQVAAHSPDVVGISTYIWNAGKLPNIIDALRGLLPEIIIVLGGPEASHNAEYWADHADFVLRGEGEGSFPAFLDARCNDILPATGFVDPFTETCLAALTGKIAYIETSRGCPFNCAFCLSGSGGVRFFPLDAVKKQIDKLAKANVRVIKFVDRTFNCDTARAYDLFEYIIGLDTANRFHFEVAADLFDARTLSLLAAAPPGLMQIEAGLQSFFAPALEASYRKADLAKAVENIRKILCSGNIHVHVDLIAGLPFETLSDFMDSFDKAYAIGAHTLQMGFLKMLHGSALRKKEKSIVYAKEPPYEIISSPWMGVSDLQTLKQTENALQNTYNKGRFLSALKYVLSVSGLRPFMLYRTLGEAGPTKRMPPEAYAGQIYDICNKLPGIESDKLIECMICDWLGMVKGVNMPPFLKMADKRQLARITKIAETTLGRSIRRSEAAVLPSGRGVFVDSESRDEVTGLYKVCDA